MIRGRSRSVSAFYEPTAVKYRKPVNYIFSYLLLPLVWLAIESHSFSAYSPDLVDAVAVYVGAVRLHLLSVLDFIVRT